MPDPFWPSRREARTAGLRRPRTAPIAVQSSAALRSRSQFRGVQKIRHLGINVMLYMVHMQVNLPTGLPKSEADRLKAEEKAYAQKLQHEGTWRHLWRIAGQYANYSVFDVSGNDELHEILSSLPLYPYMSISVSPLAQHPSAIAAN